MEFSFTPLSLILHAIIKIFLTITMIIIIDKVALVYTISTFFLPLSVLFVIFIVSLVPITIYVLSLAKPMFLAIKELPLIFFNFSTVRVEQSSLPLFDSGPFSNLAYIFISVGIENSNILLRVFSR